MKYLSKVDIVVQGIRERILTGELSAGAPLRQRDLAEAYGVSPTPVREALQRLESAGLVELDAHRGATVGRQDSGDVGKYLMMRAAMDGTASSLAARGASPEQVARMRALNEALGGIPSGDWAAYWEGNRRFHFAVHEACGSALLMSVVRLLWQSMPGSQPVQQAREISIAQHGDLVEAIAAGDHEEAERLARWHLLGSIADGDLRPAAAGA